MIAEMIRDCTRGGPRGFTQAVGPAGFRQQRHIPRGVASGVPYDEVASW
jgi:hypothetical protein